MSLRYLSISQLSEVTGKDRRTISKRLASIQPHSDEGRAYKYDAAVALDLIFASDSVQGMDKQLLKAQLGLELGKQAKIEIEVAKLRGELIPLGEIVKAVEKEYANVRAQLRAIPSKLAKILSMVTDPNEVYLRLTESIDETLTELTADKEFADKQKLMEAKTDAEIIPTAPEQPATPDEPNDKSGVIESEKLSE